jgi:hypothetical protein
MKALDKDAECRYANMQMFSEDLGRILEGRAPLARLHARQMAHQKRRLPPFRKLASSLATLMRKRKHSTNDPFETLDP